MLTRLRPNTSLAKVSMVPPCRRIARLRRMVPGRLRNKVVVIAGTIPLDRQPVKSQMQHVSGGTCAEGETVLSFGTHSQGGWMSEDVRVEVEKLQRMVGLLAIQMFELKRQIELADRDRIADYELVQAELVMRDQRFVLE
jgi:hypothetical protein